jgi:SAM-dependent methyltransferase
MSRLSALDFERRYREEPDPWGYTRSRYERDKYAATLSACGAGPFRCALELGGSIGVFSAMLAPRCEQLVTIDFAPTAVAAARARLAEHRNVHVLLGSLPGGLPAGDYDLVVASELLYYLTRSELDELLQGLRRSVVPGGRLVAAHWIPTGPERPLDARSVHALLASQDWLTPASRTETCDYLLDTWERR